MGRKFSNCIRMPKLLTWGRLMRKTRPMKMMGRRLSWTTIYHDAVMFDDPVFNVFDLMIIISIQKGMFDCIDTKILKSFEIVKKVTQGQHGQLWKAKNKKNCCLSALKKISDAFSNPAMAHRTYKEVKYLLRLSHPNIIKLNALHTSSN